MLIISVLRRCMPKSPRSIEVITTKASIGQNTIVSARRRLKRRSIRPVTNEIHGDVERASRELWWAREMRAVEKVIATGQPRTLMQAHQELVRIRPGRDALSAVWLAYYQRSVSLYEHIAKIDPGHKGEALYWAQRERVRAEEIATRIKAQTSGK